MNGRRKKRPTSFPSAFVLSEDFAVEAVVCSADDAQTKRRVIVERNDIKKANYFRAWTRSGR